MKHLAGPLLAVALAAGCYDFGKLGGADAAVEPLPDLPDLSEPVSADPDAGTCGCGDGYNCIDGSCVLAPGDCITLRSMYTPPSVPKDGVYWLIYGAQSHRAYCDMNSGTILCSNNPAPEAHNTRTRDGRNTSVNWISTMSADERSCSIWNVRADDQRPFGPLVKNTKTTMTTCQAFGFVRDQYLPSCKYGMANTGDTYKGTCGFTSTDWLVYYNNCAVRDATNGGCAMGGGELGYWQPQGPMYNVGVISTADGNKKTICTTR